MGAKRHEGGMADAAMKRTMLFGFPFINAASVDEVADLIMEDTREGLKEVRYLITPNASTVVYYNEAKNHVLKAFYSKADYILADGMPVVWISRLKAGEPLPARLTGSDLFPALWNKIKAAQLPVTMILPDEKLELFYSEDYPQASIIVPCMFAAGDDDYISTLAKAAARAVQDARSPFIFIGLNFPKQEKLGIAICSELKTLCINHAVTILLLGASFEFFAGLKARAPQWMQRGGLEWLYRFIKEPVRLGRRYTVDNFRFLLKAVRELL